MAVRGYREAGVRDQEGALSAVRRHLGPTLQLSAAPVLTRFGHYASVLRLADDLALAVTTDGVGSKTLVASALDRYDTIGFDCVAMNVNDLLCVGARPLAMVDYLGVNALDERRAGAILEGIGRAAAQAGIAVPGGEIAQLPEIIGAAGAAGERAFDLVGTCIGTLRPGELILGDAIRPGDALVGIRSSGIHSNGLTLARRVLLGPGGYRLEDDVAVLGRTLGEALLEPTLIYVAPLLALWDAGVETRGLAHVTGDGLLNLHRLDANVGYVVDDLPEVPAIFDLVQQTGAIAPEEMFRVFNMGVGFVAVVPEDSWRAAVGIIAAAGFPCARIGYVSDEPGVLRVEPAGIALAAEDQCPPRRSRDASAAYTTED